MPHWPGGMVKTYPQLCSGVVGGVEVRKGAAQAPCGEAPFGMLHGLTVGRTPLSLDGNPQGAATGPNKHLAVFVDKEPSEYHWSRWGALLRNICSRSVGW